MSAAGRSRKSSSGARARSASRSASQWRGARTQVELLAEYRAADLFALASRVARDGDRDGLPNVLVEAQSQGLACVATRVSGIPELIERRRHRPAGRAGSAAETGAARWKR